jgi:hypothetical protein
MREYPAKVLKGNKAFRIKRKMSIKVQVLIRKAFNQIIGPQTPDFVTPQATSKRYITGTRKGRDVREIVHLEMSPLGLGPTCIV